MKVELITTALPFLSKLENQLTRFHILSIQISFLPHRPQGIFFSEFNFNKFSTAHRSDGQSLHPVHNIIKKCDIITIFIMIKLGIG